MNGDYEIEVSLLRRKDTHDRTTVELLIYPGKEC
jgi:hypothetical protein